MKISNQTELRRDVSIDCSKPILTDQSYKNACDINVIMSNYAKTGMLSHTTSKEPRFIDNTMIPNLEESFKIVNTAMDTFYALPANIRKLMDNDASKLESFIADPENADLLLKSGLIIKRETQVSPQFVDNSSQEVKL